VSKFNIGDNVYVSDFGQKPKEVECPVCFGKKQVTLILGNESKAVMSCGYCTDGIGTDPKGYEIEHSFVAGVKEFTITLIETNHTAEREEVKYQSGPYLWDEDKVFATKDEALADSELDAEKYNIERRTHEAYIKHDIMKKYSWNAGYHMREVRDAKKQIEYHSEKAVICKAKAKEEVK